MSESLVMYWLESTIYNINGSLNIFTLKFGKVHLTPGPHFLYKFNFTLVKVVETLSIVPKRHNIIAIIFNSSFPVLFTFFIVRILIFIIRVKGRRGRSEESPTRVEENVGSELLHICRYLPIEIELELEWK